MKITLKGDTEPEGARGWAGVKDRTIVVHSPSLEFVACHRKSKEWR